MDPLSPTSISRSVQKPLFLESQNENFAQNFHKTPPPIFPENFPENFWKLSSIFEKNRNPGGIANFQTHA